MAGVLLVAFDQLTKWGASKNFSFYVGIDVVPHLLSFQLVHNYGAAYGIFEHQRLFLISMSVIVLLGTAWFWRWIAVSSWSKWGTTFFVAGAVGNLIDRLVYGYVIDFINIHIIPVFNIADMCINIGIGCFIVEYFVSRRVSRPE